MCIYVENKLVETKEEPSAKIEYFVYSQFLILAFLYRETK